MAIVPKTRQSCDLILKIDGEIFCLRHFDISFLAFAKKRILERCPAMKLPSKERAGKIQRGGGSGDSPAPPSNATLMLM